MSRDHKLKEQGDYQNLLDPHWPPYQPNHLTLLNFNSALRLENDRWVLGSYFVMLRRSMAHDPTNPRGGWSSPCSRMAHRS